MAEFTDVMPDREKVIKALKCCHQIHQTECFKCPYSRGNGCTYALMGDLLALLKEQERAIKYQSDRLDELLDKQLPRVMALDEIWKRGDSEPLYLEYRLPHDIKLCPAIFQPDNSDDGGGDGDMCVVSAWCASGFYNRKEYGITWRCWTSRPTDEQKGATPWETGTVNGEK